ncbi:alpha/beta-hydrolase [Exidia glandulosa HHB12029]|uniref:Alpha/beta-hydrolase n=1 Tax=Exidia glandulosa HHB12029 TaxID=1314781 RepID=A0A165AS65_EXIGL|nr:alpha/beta-hydrolase [Exidia glandulosa HHB12029]
MLFGSAIFGVLAFLPHALAGDGPSMWLTNGRFFGLANDEQQHEMYRGVPFARPPVGDLRFRKAQPVQPQCGERDAKVFPPACIQSADNTDQSEDCLYMDIYRPYGTNKNSSLPIFVWIHGGSWQGGSATTISWNLAKHAREDGRPFIHIGIQYRLNAFGLLASEGMDQQDLNAALSDQQEALRYIKKNARRMGGDPDKIVLGGSSAGASGTALQWLYSNPEEKLFRGIILGSGGPLQYPQNDVKDYDGPDGPTTKLINLANCQRDQLKDSIQCLRDMPLEELRKHTTSVMSGPGHYTAWPPCFDGLFIKERASDWMKAGKQNRVPIFVARNRDEGTVFTPAETKTEDDIRALVTSVLIPQTLDDSVFQGLLDAYPNDPSQGSPFGTGDNLFGKDPMWKRGAAIFGDWKYTSTARHALRMAAAQGVDAWGYLWLVSGGDNGASHTADAGMVFRADDPPEDVRTSAMAIQRGYIRFISDLNPGNEDGTPWQNYKDVANILKFDKNATIIQTDDYRSAGIEWVLNNLPAWKK